METSKLLPKWTRRWSRNPDDDQPTESLQLSERRESSSSFRSPDVERSSDNIRDRCIAYGYTFAGMIFMMTGYISVQILDGSVPHWELSGIRFTVQFMINLPLISRTQRSDFSELTKAEVGWLVLSGVFKSTCTNARYDAYRTIPLGVAYGYYESFSLCLNCFVSCVSKSPLLVWKLISTVLCVLGVLLMVQPSSVFDPDERLFGNVSYVSLCAENSTQSLFGAELSGTWFRDEVISYFALTFSAVAFSGDMHILNKKLPGINIFLYNFWTAFVGIVVNFVLMGAVDDPRVPAGSLCRGLVVVYCVTVASMSLLYNRAYQLLPPVVVSLVTMSSLPILFILQYAHVPGLLPGRANSLEITGAVVVFVGVVILPVVQLACPGQKERDQESS